MTIQFYEHFILITIGKSITTNSFDVNPTSHPKHVRIHQQGHCRRSSSNFSYQEDQTYILPNEKRSNQSNEDCIKSIGEEYFHLVWHFYLLYNLLRHFFNTDTLKFGLWSQLNSMFNDWSE